VNGFEVGLKRLKGMASFCFPLSFFCGEKGLKVAKGAVVSAVRDDCKSFGDGLETDEVWRGGVDGGPSERKIEEEGAAEVLESFL
jgi:hypothetical protein